MIKQVNKINTITLFLFGNINIRVFSGVVVSMQGHTLYRYSLHKFIGHT